MIGIPEEFIKSLSENMYAEDIEKASKQVQ